MVSIAWQFEVEKNHQRVVFLTNIQIIIIASIQYCVVQACDKTSCTQTPAHYDELGCDAILDEDGCCPIR